MSEAARRLETRVELEIPFHHVDALRIVWHGHYPKYFEAAAMALLRRLELDGGDLVDGRHRLVVIESSCRFAYPLRYAERVAVSAWLGDFERRLKLHHEIINLSRGRRAARGHTILALLDADGRLRLEIPGEIRQRIAGAEAAALPLATGGG